MAPVCSRSGSKQFTMMGLVRSYALLASMCASLALVVVFWIQRNTQSPLELGVRLPNSDTADTIPAALVPGELPGYTGYARLEQTLAGFFRVASRETAASVGDEWTVMIRCMKCQGRNAQLYARAYGPAVLAGSVYISGIDTYTIGFLPMDPGSYVVEVVLVSSDAPSWNDFPVVGTEPSYEGYLLPGFPVQFHVTSSSLSSPATQTCSFSDLMSDSIDSAYHSGRWVVVDKVVHRHHHIVATNSSMGVSLEGYRSGHNSLGVFMEYKRRDCSLLSIGEASAILSMSSRLHPMHVIFIGDSVMRMQYNLFRNLHPSANASLVSTSGGIARLMNNVTTELLGLESAGPLYILVNTGLHDIAQLCSRKWHTVRQGAFGPDYNFSCALQYRKSLSELIEFIRAYPAEVKVFQSTTAGWPRYGNFGIGWPPNMTQDLAMSSNMVAHFNEIAYDVLAQIDEISVLDAFWLTLARPDNRQVDLTNALGKRLVHPGQEVLETMVRLWMTALVGTIHAFA